MDFQSFLSRITSLGGLSGHEAETAQAIADAFRPYVDRTEVDRLQNVVAVKGHKGPRIMVAAHQDEIGLVVLDIEKDGCLRFCASGGVDTRILPAMPVVVHTRAGALMGVIGAKPPHLLTREDEKNAVQMKDLFIDVGLPGERARERVRVGDQVTLTGRLTSLADGRFAGKTLDDRACVAGMLLAAERVSRLDPPCQVAFVATTQEEVGSRGARVAAWNFEPDAAIAIDVTHGPTIGAGKWETYPLDCLAIATGPNIHPALRDRLVKAAKDNHVAYQIEPCAGVTPTDAEVLQSARAGVPTVLLSVPVKYMHTTVEMADAATIEELGRLIALFIDELSRGWEAIKWN